MQVSAATMQGELWACKAAVCWGHPLLPRGAAWLAEVGLTGSPEGMWWHVTAGGRARLSPDPLRCCRLMECQGAAGSQLVLSCCSVGSYPAALLTDRSSCVHDVLPALPGVPDGDSNQHGTWDGSSHLCLQKGVPAQGPAYAQPFVLAGDGGHLPHLWRLHLGQHNAGAHPRHGAAPRRCQIWCAKLSLPPLQLASACPQTDSQAKGLIAVHCSFMGWRFQG